MGDMTGLVLIAAAGGAFILFNKQIMDWIDKNMPQPTPPPAETPAAGGDAGTAPPPVQNTTNIIAPSPLGIGYPLIAGYPGYPYGYAPYGGYPWAWPPVIGHFSAPRWFNNYPRFPGYGGYPYPRPGPRFLGPPVPAPFPHH